MRGEGRRHCLWLATGLFFLALTAMPVAAQGPPPEIDGVDPAAGPTEGGTQVTLTGKHLAKTTRVQFDGTEVDFEASSNQQITTTSPPHAAQVVAITVTTRGGSASIDFEYVAPPAIDALSPDHGHTQGGETVSIEGSGLAETTAVRFGSVAADFEILGDSEIEAVTPPHAAGTVDVVVETPYGTATSPFAFVAPPPAITGIEPAQGSSQGGDEVTIHGSGLNETHTVRFGAVDAASFEVLDDDTVRAITPEHAAGTVALRIVTPHGDADQSFTFQQPASEEAPGPVIDQLAPSSGPTDGGTQITITGEGLANVTSVTFGEKAAASWQIESDERVIAVAPPHAEGTVQVGLHGEGTATASYTYQAPTEPTNEQADDSTDEPTDEPSDEPSSQESDGPQKEEVQSAADPVQTGTPADVVRSGTPDLEGIGSCWVLLAADTPGARLAIPFPESCEVEAVVVEVPEALGLINVSVQPMTAIPADVPSPGMVHGPGLVFEAVIRDMEGREIAPSGAVLQVRMPGAWFDECPPEACATDLFHYDGGNWSTHTMRAVDRSDGFLVMQADVSSFSLFAVGGTPRTAVDQSAGPWPWAWMIGAFAMVGAPTAVTVWRRRKTSDDPKVGMLLREMSDKEELLQFLNNAAHDLANPLTPIQLQLDLLIHAAETSDPEEQRRSLRGVQQNVEQMTMLVGDLRDAAKVRSGRLRFFPAQHELGSVMEEATAMVEAQAAQAGISLTYGAPESEIPVRIDRGRIMQVTTNLLGNAIKFTPKGGRVDLSVDTEGATAHVRVTDTGLGMAPEDQNRLFEPFSQSHGDAEKAKGTGLGLYIAKGIVEAHDGQIGCHSDGPSKGSTFWFTLPLHAA